MADQERYDGAPETGGEDPEDLHAHNEAMEAVYETQAAGEEAGDGRPAAEHEAAPENSWYWLGYDPDLEAGS